MKPVLYDKLTYAERAAVRERYIIEQDGLCYLCGCPLAGPPPIEVSRTIAKHPLYKIFARGSFNHHVQLHHSHYGPDKGYTLGAVHFICNAYLKIVCGE